MCASECDSCLLLLVAVCLFDFCFCLVYARFFIAASICVHFAVQLVVVVVRVLAVYFDFFMSPLLRHSLFTLCHKWRLIYQFVFAKGIHYVPSSLSLSPSYSFSLFLLLFLYMPLSFPPFLCALCLALCLALNCCLFAINDVVIFIASLFSSSCSRSSFVVCCCFVIAFNGSSIGCNEFCYALLPYHPR